MTHRRLYLGQAHWTTILPWVGVLGVVICLFLQVFISNRYAVSGRFIKSVDADIKQLSDDNSSLREKIASASSTLTVIQKAQELGFVKHISPAFLTADLPVAVGLQ